MSIKTVVKDVEEELLKKRQCKRRPGDIIYPLDYTNDLVNFDNWDHMCYTKCCRNITMTQFTSPPSSVLDLGCGRGLFAIEAAKQWKESFIVGFDIITKQPPLRMLDPSIARRLEWVQGNFLDPLPFKAEQFDFVRMARLGLHIPEDEWQYVLEEVARVLKPGGVLELIEEDLIFPCQRLEPAMTLSPEESSSVKSSTRSCQTAMSDPHRKHESSRNASASRNRSTETFITVPTSPSIVSIPETILEPREPKPPESDPRDHSRLKQAWEQMLDSRFLATQLLSVLYFYLNASFVDIRSPTPLQIPLPPNSCSAGNSQPLPNEQIRGFLDAGAIFTGVSKRISAEMDIDKNSMRTEKSSQRSTKWARMHLARTVRIISGCKEAIYQAYQRLHANNPDIPRIMTAARLKDIRNRRNDISTEDLEPSTYWVRGCFQQDWDNWQTDMADRIGMRGMVSAELLWAEPQGKPPDWREWQHSSSNEPILDETEPDLCRNIRGFVCWKPYEHDNASLNTLVVEPDYTFLQAE